VNSIAVRRDIADLILEAVDIAASRRLAGPVAHAFVLDVLAVERPDISATDAHRLVERYGRRLNGRAALLDLPQGVAIRATGRCAE
jgi:hypothetical protein